MPDRPILILIAGGLIALSVICFLLQRRRNRGTPMDAFFSHRRRG